MRTTFITDTIRRTGKKITAFVLSGIICASVFANICTNTVLAYNSGIEAFVNSLYSDCLGRSADPTGFNDWCNKLATGQITGKQAAYGFFFSPEFGAKAGRISADDLINTYYKVFLNRDADPAGKTYWSGKIASTSTTDDIIILFNGFADSVEFANKCASYGITVGTVSTPAVGPSGQAAQTANANNLAAQTNGQRANSVEELDAYWTSQGYEVFYIDLGNGQTQKCYAQFYDMTEHYNLVNAWRNEQGIYSLTPITDPNDVRYQYCKRRAVEISYYFAHVSPMELPYRQNGIFLSDAERGIPANGAGENIAAVCDPVRSFEMFRDSGLHAAGMRNDLDAHYITVVGCHVVFVNADGISTTTTSPCPTPRSAIGSGQGYGDGTAQILWT